MFVCACRFCNFCCLWIFVRVYSERIAKENQQQQQQPCVCDMRQTKLHQQQQQQQQQRPLQDGTHLTDDMAAPSPRPPPSERSRLFALAICYLGTDFHG